VLVVRFSFFSLAEISGRLANCKRPLKSMALLVHRRSTLTMTLIEVQDDQQAPSQYQARSQPFELQASPTSPSLQP
jgi:hypothetical protein